MSAKQDYEDKKIEHAAFVETMRESAKRYFAEASKHLFDTHPELVSFSWTQYTPYFNDGDTCTFGANEVSEINEQESYDLEENSILEPALKDCGNFVSSFDDDDLEAMFGDHVRVICTRDGVDTESYDHD